MRYSGRLPPRFGFESTHAVYRARTGAFHLHRSIGVAWSLSIPLAVLASAFFALHYLTDLPYAVRVLLPVLPYLVCALTGGLAVLFGQGRVLLTALLIALTAWQLTHPPSHAFASVTVWHALVILVPLNIALLRLLSERGALTHHVLMRFGFLAVQALGVVWIIHAERYDVLAWFAAERLPFSVGIPEAGLYALIASALILAWRVGWRTSPVESATLVGLLTLALAFWQRGSEHAVPVYLTAIGVMLAIALVLSAHNIAYRDELTGLPGRRALNQRLATLGRRYALAMLDIDHFKKFNDTYGHDIGDQVLKMVAAQLRTVGGGGKAFRYGGEEFTIVFPGRDPDDVIPYLEDVRETIADYRLVLRNPQRPDTRSGRQQRGQGAARRKSVRVTISIGVAARSKELRTTDEVLKAADQALYRAKGAGRNRVCT